MITAFTITRPNGEKWEMLPHEVQHESRYAQWWKLIRNGELALYALIPKKYGRREIIREFEMLLNPKIEEVTL